MSLPALLYGRRLGQRPLPAPHHLTSSGQISALLESEQLALQHFIEICQRLQQLFRGDPRSSDYLNEACQQLMQIIQRQGMPGWFVGRVARGEYVDAYSLQYHPGSGLPISTILGSQFLSVARPDDLARLLIACGIS